MDYEIVWSMPAAADFEAIIRYLARRTRVGAESVRIGILETVEVVARFPLSGSLYSGDPSGRTREVLYGAYRLFYSVNEAARQVEILAVWHSARRDPMLPP